MASDVHGFRKRAAAVKRGAARKNRLPQATESRPKEAFSLTKGPPEGGFLIQQKSRPKAAFPALR
jgi:hypothetical protein